MNYLEIVLLIALLVRLKPSWITTATEEIIVEIL